MALDPASSRETAREDGGGWCKHEKSARCILQRRRRFVVMCELKPFAADVPVYMLNRVSRVGDRGPVCGGSSTPRIHGLAASPSCLFSA